jgi:hypothetical protein
MLKLGEDLSSQIEHHVLADVIKKNFLGVRKNKPKNEDSEESEGKEPHPVDPFRSDEVIDGNLRKIRLRADQNVCQQRQGQCGGDGFPIRLEISREPTCNAEIVCFPDRIFFVIFFRFV